MILINIKVLIWTSYSKEGSNAWRFHNPKKTIKFLLIASLIKKVILVFKNFWTFKVFLGRILITFINSHKISYITFWHKNISEYYLLINLLTLSLTNLFLRNLVFDIRNSNLLNLFLFWWLSFYISCWFFKFLKYF